MRSSLLALALAVTAAPAAADPDRAPYEPELRPRDFVRVELPAGASPAPDAPPPSRILYLNDCKPAGCAITQAEHDDARRDESAIARHDGVLSPYSGSDASWAAIVACVRANYAPFTIVVTTVDPGDVPHYEAYAAGLPSELGFPGPVAGISSFACGVIPNALSFSFLGLAPDDVDDACWTISQESAHNFGLAHSMLRADAMTYYPFPAKKTFVDATACIGTQGCCQPMRECQCGMTEQNSYQRLLAIFGPAGATGPDIVIESPVAGESVLPGFTVRAAVTDLDGVARVELRVDGQPAAWVTDASGDYELRAPTDLVAGAHAVTIRATDARGSARDATIVVDVDQPCTTDASCAAAGPDRVCEDRRCVRAAPASGGGCSTSTGGAALPTLLALLAAISGCRGSRRRSPGSRSRASAPPRPTCPRGRRRTRCADRPR